jgi:outer membrane protein TolC
MDNFGKYTTALLVIVLISITVSFAQVNQLTFEEALNLTMQNNHLLKQSGNKTLQMEQEMKAAKGLYLPRVSLNASYAFMSDDISLDLTPVRDAIAPLYQTLGNYGNFSDVPNPDPNTNGIMPILPENISTAVVREKMLEGLNTINSANWVSTIQEKQFAVLNAGFMMPIYTGGKINAANRAARIHFEESEIETIQKSYKLSCELVERYFGLMLSRQAKRVREEVKRTMEQHYSDAQKLQNEGMIASVEALNAKVYFSESDRELKKADRQVEILNDALLNTVAIEDGGKIEPLTNLFYLEEIEPIDYFYTKALEKSPLLAQVNKKKELAHQGYKAEVSSYLPTIAATGTYDIANKDLSPYLPDYVVGVGLSWTLFDGMARDRKIKAARYQESQADDYFNKANADIKTAITKYYQEMNMYLEQLKMLEAAMEFTNEYYRARQRAFAEGMATSTQVSDANLAVAKAKIERLQAMYGYDVALSKLLYYAGISDQYAIYMGRADSGQDNFQVSQRSNTSVASRQ